PEGQVSLRCMVGGARDPDAIDHADESLLGMVLEELRPILGLRGEPVLKRVYRYGKGIPQYNLGHLGRVEAVERQLWSTPGLFLAGNAYRGVGLNDCVREARRKARAVLEYLRQ
ncbi:MAG: protoporphyrinogen/coproporphyrinogen oxidase, partial [Thermoanaerobaculia bacterium]